MVGNRFFDREKSFNTNLIEELEKKKQNFILVFIR